MDSLFRYLADAIGLVKALAVGAFLLLLIGAYANRQITPALFWKALAFVGALIALVLAALWLCR